MVPPPVPPNEPTRAAALRAYDILDTADEDIFDAITKAAAAVCATSMASLTFVDTDRQWLKSRFGITSRETSRDVSFCAHAINGQDLFIVEDASADLRFHDNPLVTGDPKLRFYAGMPLVDPGGLSIGALCVLDVVPKHLNKEQENILSVLAESVMRVLNLRQRSQAAVFANAVDLTSDGITISVADHGSTSIIYANEAFLNFTEYSYHEIIDRPSTFPAGENSHQLSEEFANAFATGQMSTAEFQFRKKGGELAWDRLSLIPYVDEGCNLLYMVAIHRNITCQKEADAQTQQLHAMRTTMATVNHIVNNFMNAAQLYCLQSASGSGQMDAKTKVAFEAALQSTRRQLAEINRMSSFRDRPTPFGISLLDPDESKLIG